MKTRLNSDLWNVIPLFMVGLLIIAVIFTVCLDIIYGNKPTEEIPYWINNWLYGK